MATPDLSRPRTDGPRILVVGAGAIGGVTAAHLARAGQDVVVLDADRRHVALLGDPGLRLDHLGTERVVPVTAVTDARDLVGHFDFALLTLKAAHLPAALTALTATGVVDTYVCLGNGLVQEVARAHVAGHRLLVGVTEWGGTNLGPGAVAQTTVAPFVIGEPDGRTSPRVLSLADALAPVAEVVVSEDVTGHVWTKLLLNSTFSGLGAVSGGLYADVAADPLGRRVAHALWTEAYDVARAAGIGLLDLLDLDPETLVVRGPADLARASDALDRLMSRLGPTKASMLQDLERGARTEVDVINGGVVATAERHGVAAPGHQAVVDAVHRCEEGLQTPGAHAFAQVAEALHLTGARA